MGKPLLLTGSRGVLRSGLSAVGREGMRGKRRGVCGADEVTFLQKWSRIRAWPRGKDGISFGKNNRPSVFERGVPRGMTSAEKRRGPDKSVHQTGKWERKNRKRACPVKKS